MNKVIKIITISIVCFTITLLSLAVFAKTRNEWFINFGKSGFSGHSYDEFEVGYTFETAKKYYEYRNVYYGINSSTKTPPDTWHELNPLNCRKKGIVKPGIEIEEYCTSTTPYVNATSTLWLRASVYNNHCASPGYTPTQKKECGDTMDINMSLYPYQTR